MADKIDSMLLRRVALLALLLPGFLMGPGWDLRVCIQSLVNSTCCRSTELTASCCSSESPSSDQPEQRFDRECDGCCLHIATPAERYVANQNHGVDQFERSQIAALTFSAADIDLLAPRPIDERRTIASTGSPPTTPGRCTPLPLRI